MHVAIGTPFSLPKFELMECIRAFKCWHGPICLRFWIPPPPPLPFAPATHRAGFTAVHLLHNMQHIEKLKQRCSHSQQQLSDHQVSGQAADDIPSPPQGRLECFYLLFGVLLLHCSL